MVKPPPSCRSLMTRLADGSAPAFYGKLLCGTANRDKKRRRAIGKASHPPHIVQFKCLRARRRREHRRYERGGYQFGCHFVSFMKRRMGFALPLVSGRPKLNRHSVRLWQTRKT